MVYEHISYQSFLKGVLIERSQKNDSYSLRAMARQLGLSPSLLSEVLNGNRHLTEENAVFVADKLGLQEKEQLYFRTLVQLGRAKKPEVKQVLLNQLQKLHPKSEVGHDLSVDHFIYVSDWHHFALMRLMDISDFVFSPGAAAKALNIHPFEVDAALERLVRLELVEKTVAGKFVKLRDNVLVKAAGMNDALRKYHKQALEKTIDALSAQTPSERFTGTENITLSSDQLSEASEIYEECFKKILNLSKKRKKGAEVYHLGIHMIRLSKIQKTKNDRTKKESNE